MIMYKSTWKWLVLESIHSYTANLKMTNMLESIEVMLMISFKQEQMNGKLTQMISLND